MDPLWSRETSSLLYETTLCYMLCKQSIQHCDLKEQNSVFACPAYLQQITYCMIHITANYFLKTSSVLRVLTLFFYFL